MNNNLEIVGYIYKTTDYEQFKFLNENRDVENNRANKIGKSIDQNGYIFNPISTNEKKEIIDGQGRFTALKQRNLPVYFYEINGAGADECRVLNKCNSNWKTIDYVKSYALAENENYTNLLTVYQRHKQLGLATVVCAITGMMEYNNASIINGTFKFNKKDIDCVEDVISYLERFQPMIEKMPGRRQQLYTAIRFCYSCTPIDNERLFDKFCLKYREMSTPNDVKQCMKMLEGVYNDKIRKENKVYFEVEYDKYLCGKYPYYKNRWGLEE